MTASKTNPQTPAVQATGGRKKIETNDNPTRTSGKRRWLGLGVLAAGLSMIVLDGTIVGVALPVLIDDLHMDLSDAQWVNGIYSVVFAALLLTAGRLGDRLGRRRMFIIGILVFVGGSLLAAIATGASTLILARVVQGLGGALILPSTLSTVNATFRGRDRAIAFGVWGAVIAGMAAFGPLIGGWLTTSFSWQWIFLVNLPFGLLILVGALFAVDETRSSSMMRGFDVSGLILSALGFGAVVFAMIEGRTLGWWTPDADLNIFGLTWPTSAPLSPTPVVGAIGIVALVLFVFWERRRARLNRSAILDLNLFQIATFTWGNLAALCVAIGEFGLLFVLPLFIVNAMGLNTLGAGLVLAAMGAGAFASGTAARVLSERMGAPTVVLLGLAIEVVGVVGTAFFIHPGSSPWLLALVLAGYGLGLGLASAQLTGTVLKDIPTEQSGQGSATQSTVRQVGAALGTAVIGAVLAAGLAGGLAAQLENVPGVPPAAAQQLVDSTTLSAGGTIPALRAQGVDGTLGEAGPAVASALSDGFADATRVSMFTAAGFLVVGFAFAVRLRSRSDLADHETKQRDGA